MEIIRYTSKDDLQHFIERNTNLIELLRNATFQPVEIHGIEDDKEEYQFNIPIKIIIPEEE